MLRDGEDRWTAIDAEELYEVSRWGKGYFSIARNGNLLVHPERNPSRNVDLKQLVERLRLRGISLPVLIRFNDILKNRLEEINRAFQKAIDDHEYSGSYRCVYPIKVNQQRQVVEQILEHGVPYGFGLEAGSKPELLAIVALTDNQTPIVCNGFKDAEFIEMALWAQKIGKWVIPVVEKFTELQLLLDYAKSLNVRPQIGMRVKLASRGSGRWQSSGGYRSKFGLTVTEILRALEQLKSLGMQDCFRLLHFHLGSQITNIRHIKAALIEASRIYVDLAQRGAGLAFFDVGGGLGVDYDGSQTNFESSANYDLQEYANDVIFQVQSICNDADIKCPDIISESGRAVAAYHSVLVFEVLGISGPSSEHPPSEIGKHVEQSVRNLFETYQQLNIRNVLESFHDAQQAFEIAIASFAAGYLPLDQRSVAEQLFWNICKQIQELTKQLEYVPEELEGLDHYLSDTYFCNFSLFQSLPDSWAIKQIFPIIPIHRLDEKPTKRGLLGDVTCDSDGKIEQFVDHRGVARTLPLHEPNQDSYMLATFLIGAYQEILGDMHNLFGDTNAVHIDLSETGEVLLKSIIKGDSVSEVLNYVQFSDDKLISHLQSAVEQAVHDSLIDHGDAGRFLKFFEECLAGYTYLE